MEKNIVVLLIKHIMWEIAATLDEFGDRNYADTLNFINRITRLKERVELHLFCPEVLHEIAQYFIARKTPFD